MCFCPADFLRSALHLLRYGIRLLRGQKTIVRRNRGRRPPSTIARWSKSLAANRCCRRMCCRLMTLLADAGRTVLLETSGAHDISAVDPRVHRIMDLKTPGSGEVERNLFSNIEHLTSRDEVKFVIGSREDYEWSRAQLREHRLARALPGGAFLADLRADRSARDRGMDPGRQSPRSVPAPDAQVHLDADAARGLAGEHAPDCTDFRRFAEADRFVRSARSMDTTFWTATDRRLRFGRKAVSKPISGRKAQS